MAAYRITNINLKPRKSSIDHCRLYSSASSSSTLVVVWAESSRSKVKYVLAGSGTADQEKAGLGQLASASAWRTKTELVRSEIRSKRCRKILSVLYGEPNRNRLLESFLAFMLCFYVPYHSLELLSDPYTTQCGHPFCR